MKSTVHETAVTSDTDLVSGIAEAVTHVLDTPAQFERVRESMNRRSETCIVRKEVIFVICCDVIMFYNKNHINTAVDIIYFFLIQTCNYRPLAVSV